MPILGGNVSLTRRVGGDVNVGLAANPPTIQDIFGDGLLLDIDPWGRSDLTVEAGGYVSAVQSVVGGATYSQAIGSAMPASTNGDRKVPKGDGIDDELTTLSTAWAPTGISFSVGGFGRCDLDAVADTTLHSLFALGTAGNSRFSIERMVAAGDPGKNKIVAYTYDGASGTRVGNLASDDVLGGFYWWFDYNITTGESSMRVNGVLTQTLTLASLLVNTTRSRLFANSGGSAGLFGKLNLGQLILTTLATEDQRNAAMAIFAARAALIEAA